MSTPHIAYYTSQGYDWSPVEGPDSEEITRRIDEVLTSWEDTPYMAGEQAKGVGTDCIRFVCGAMDELYGTSHPIPREMQDISMHNTKGAVRIMKKIRENWPNHRTLGPDERILQPGDVIVTGQAQGGPGHAILVGAQRNTVYQATKKGVRKGGWGFISYFQQIVCVCRPTDKDSWLR